MAGWCPRAAAFLRWTNALGSMKNSPVAANHRRPLGMDRMNASPSSGVMVADLRGASGPLKWHITQEMSQTSVLAIPPTWSGVIALLVFYVVNARAPFLRYQCEHFCTPI